MEYILRENETSRLSRSSEPSNSLGHWPQATINTERPPENLGAKIMDVSAGPMRAVDHAGGASEADPRTVPSMEPARELETWSQAERNALALGSYIFKSDSNKVAAVVGTKTVRIAHIHGLQIELWRGLADLGGDVACCATVHFDVHNVISSFLLSAVPARVPTGRFLTLNLIVLAGTTGQELLRRRTCHLARFPRPRYWAGARC